MRGSIRLQDRHSETRMFKTRVWVSAAFTLIFFSFLIGRLIYLQILDHEHFSTLSRNNRIKLMAVAPTRGLIYDRHGRLLADNLPNYQLEITPEQVPNLAETLQNLGQLIELREIDIERFKTNLRRQRSFEGIPLRFNLNDEEVAHLAVNKHRFPGVDIAARLSRAYPYGSIGVHAIGYVGRIDEDDLKHLDQANYKATTHIGKVGIEEFYEHLLHGRVGVQHVEVNVEGRILRVLDETAPEPGKNLYLSLDIELQKHAEEALGEFSGSIIALSPKTGEILAFVSKPIYDPHPFVNGISITDYQILRDAPARPLFNRALMGLYPPGSTIKPLLGLAALENTLIHREDHQVFCKGYYTLPRNERRYRDWLKQGHGRVNLSMAIEQSCDVFFYDLAYRMGIETLAGFLKKFGLGRKTNIDLNGEKSGLVPDAPWKQKAYKTPWFPGETLNAGLGQGYMQTTPLQLATAIATLANMGKPIEPKLLYAMENNREEKKSLVHSNQKMQTIPIKDASAWHFIKTAMINVVHGERGTARAIGYKSPYKIAGKTGTAQVISIAQDEEYDAKTLEQHLHDHALFVAFAPAEDPEISIAVIVENGGSGGRIAAPIAKKILEFYFQSNAAAKMIQK